MKSYQIFELWPQYQTFSYSEEFNHLNYRTDFFKEDKVCGKGQTENFRCAWVARDGQTDTHTHTHTHTHSNSSRSSKFWTSVYYSTKNVNVDLAKTFPKQLTLSQSKKLCRNNYDRKLKSARKLKPSLQSYMSCSIQLESRLRILGAKSKLQIIPCCLTSMGTHRAVFYFETQKLRHYAKWGKFMGFPGGWNK